MWWNMNIFLQSNILRYIIYPTYLWKSVWFNPITKYREKLRKLRIQAISKMFILHNIPASVMLFLKMENIYDISIGQYTGKTNMTFFFWRYHDIVVQTNIFIKLMNKYQLMKWYIDKVNFFPVSNWHRTQIFIYL